MATYGYIRVSSKDQNEDRQVIAMEQDGVNQDNIVIDKQSGKDFDRPGYQELMKKISVGDTIVIKSIDRFGRNYEEILEQWRIITKEKHANVRVIDMPLLNTSSGDKNLTQTFVADLVLQILSYVAQTERDAIKQRQREGIAAAHARGVKFGRPEVPYPDDFEDIVEAWHNGYITTEEAINRSGMSRATLYRRASKSKCTT